VQQARQVAGVLTGNVKTATHLVANRLPMLIAVCVAAIIVILGSIWFVLRPVELPHVPQKLKPSPYSPFVDAPHAGP